MASNTDSTTADVIIIGAGPGGYVAAIRLAQLGQSVTVIEREALGGVCLNWGCIPSKALIYAGALYDKIKHADMMGIEIEGVKLNVPKLQSWKNGVVEKLTGGIGQLFKAHGISVVYGAAEFTDAHTIQVLKNDGASETLSAKQFIIATGSIPMSIPGFELDGKTIIDSRQALSLEAVPAKLAILGGGVIGLEIALMYQKLGSEITIIEMAPQLLAGMDQDIVQAFSRSLKKRKINVLTGAKATAAKKPAAAAGVVIEIQDANGNQQHLETDLLLIAVGRKPNSATLGLEKVGVKTDVRGFITVDKQLRSSVPHIFAIGDVTAPPLLAHKASKEGLVAASVAAGGDDILDYRAMPSAIFTDPEIATVGLSEEAAIQEGYQVKVGKFPFQASGRALSMNQAEGFVKVITDAKSDIILGVHMIGPDVAELIAEAALAIELGATAEDLALTVHAHPTLPESLMEAAEAVHQKAIHIFTPSVSQSEKNTARRTLANQLRE